MFLTFFFSRLKCGAFLFSGEGIRIVLAPHLSGGYVAMHDINIGGAERNIFLNCIDELWMGGKPEKFK